MLLRVVQALPAQTIRLDIVHSGDVFRNQRGQVMFHPEPDPHGHGHEGMGSHAPQPIDMGLRVTLSIKTRMWELEMRCQKAQKVKNIT